MNALFYVDFVSSACGVHVSVKDWNIDLGLLGTQKAISTPPDLSIVTVSQRAWQVIEEVNYVGYDALLPFQFAVSKKFFPYTHNWHGMAALHFSLEKLQKEGLNNVYKRHQEVAKYCRKRLNEMGIQLFHPLEDISNSPTVTAAYLPIGWTWKELDKQLRNRGVIFGGSYGKLSDKVFRIGHMGSQADMNLVKEALDILNHVIKS